MDGAVLMVILYYKKKQMSYGRQQCAICTCAKCQPITPSPLPAYSAPTTSTRTEFQLVETQKIIYDIKYLDNAKTFDMVYIIVPNKGTKCKGLEPNKWYRANNHYIFVCNELPAISEFKNRFSECMRNDYKSYPQKKIAIVCRDIMYSTELITLLQGTGSDMEKCDWQDMDDTASCKKEVGRIDSTNKPRMKNWKKVKNSTC